MLQQAGAIPQDVFADAAAGGADISVTRSLPRSLPLGEAAAKVRRREEGSRKRRMAEERGWWLERNKGVVKQGMGETNVMY